MRWCYYCPVGFFPPIYQCLFPTEWCYSLAGAHLHCFNQSLDCICELSVLITYLIISFIFFSFIFSVPSYSFLLLSTQFSFFHSLIQHPFLPNCFPLAPPSIPSSSFLKIFSLLQEDARADVVDCVVRDIQNSQCLLNVEYSGATCPHVTIQFGDTKDDVGLGLVKEGLVMVDVRKEKHLQKMVSEERRCDAGDASSHC